MKEYKSPEWHRERCSKKFKDWKGKVIKRDEGICQKCGSDEDLIAHHIYSFKTCVSGRYLKSNGITLCQRCHRAFHKSYGIKKNNQKQIDEFISFKSLTESCYKNRQIGDIPLFARRKNVFVALMDNKRERGVQISRRTLEILFRNLHKDDKLGAKDREYIKVLLGTKIYIPEKEVKIKPKHIPIKSKYYRFSY